MLQCYRKPRTMSTQIRTFSDKKIKDSESTTAMPTRSPPQGFSWFYQRVAVFLFFLADVFNLTEKESNQGLSWQFPPTGTAGSNQKRTRSSSK